MIAHAHFFKWEKLSGKLGEKAMWKKKEKRNVEEKKEYEKIWKR